MMTSDFFPPPAGQPGAGPRAILHVPPGAKPLSLNGSAHTAVGASSPVDLQPGPVAKSPEDQTPSIDAADWDILFSAIEIRLRQAVGEHLGEMPATPAHSAQLSASLVQAVVLDCVDALHKLHAAIRHDRSQRPTA